MSTSVPSEPSKSKKSRWLAPAVVLLVAGLAIGAGVGYSVAPKSQTTPPAGNVIVIPDSTVHLGVLAGPMPEMFSFVFGGLKNPTIQVKPGAQITVHFLSIDTDLNHSLVFVSQAPPYSGSFTAQPVFPGAQTSNPLTGVAPEGNTTFSFTASSAGTYWYLCGVPGHASSGMYGKFVVQS